MSAQRAIQQDGYDETIRRLHDYPEEPNGSHVRHAAADAHQFLEQIAARRYKATIRENFANESVAHCHAYKRGAYRAIADYCGDQAEKYNLTTATDSNP